jgi:Holliday junction resolvase RusA-like endonuclease
VTLTLPIYYTEQFKTKPDKISLVGMNLYRNAHYHLQNKLKQHYNQLVTDQIQDKQSFDKFTVEYQLFYKSPVCDASNVIALIEKFTLDALKLNGVITDDNVQYHQGSSYSVAGCDKINPRVEITIKELS